MAKPGRIKWTILLICGLWTSFDQWTRILLPFAQWQLQPKPDMYFTLILNSLANGAILVGTFIIAHLVDSIGTRRTAILSTLCTCAFQALYSWTTNLYLFGALQLLLLLNNMPAIVDATIGQLGSQLADVKAKTRLFMLLAIPSSIAFAVGPLMAVQLFYMFSPVLEVIQSACGLVHFVTLMPILYFLLPETDEGNSQGGKGFSSLANAFVDICADANNRWTLLFIMMVVGPHNAYDQIIRLHLTGHMLTKPMEMGMLALLLGGTALSANFLLLPFLLKRFRTQRIVQMALVLMALSYFYLIHVTDYQHIALGMPIQIVGVSLTLGILTTQLMSAVPRSHIGKAAALSQLAQMAASIMAPLVSGMYTEHGETLLLCSINIGVSCCALLLVELRGSFLGRSAGLFDLPTSTHVE